MTDSTHQDYNYIDQALLRDLSKTKPYRHVVAMILDWLVILTTIYLCDQYFTPGRYFVAVLVIGARMHALAILAHDAAHLRFFPSNRRWNDLLTNIFTMYLLLFAVEDFRTNHASHHKHVNTDDDPDWISKQGKTAYEFPKKKQGFLSTVASYLLLYKGIGDFLWMLERVKQIKKAKANSSGKNTQEQKAGGFRFLYYFVLAVTFTRYGLWTRFFVYWMVPLLTAFLMFHYVRSVAEHFGMSHDHKLTSSRTVLTNGFEAFFLAPHNSGYHLEHHLYPSVPFYNLPALHKALMANTHYSQKAHITKGYLSGLVQELEQYRPHLAKLM